MQALKAIPVLTAIFLALPATSTLAVDSAPVQGNSNGGGGHLCKSQAALFNKNLVAVLDENPELFEKYPEWKQLRNIMNPQKNPGFTIKISSRPIKGCPNTETPVACSLPKQNTMELYCGENGFNALPLKEKYKQVAHELYWWSSLNDANYFYSGRFIDEVFPLLQATQEISQSFLSLKEGEITSTESMLNQITACEPHDYQDSGYGRWQKTAEGMVCSDVKVLPNTYSAVSSCQYRGSIDYSIIINKKYSMTQISSFANEVPVGTIFKHDLCRPEARSAFSYYSLRWFQRLERVKTGEVAYKDSRPQRCYKNVFQASYDSISGTIESSELAEISAKCP